MVIAEDLDLDVAHGGDAAFEVDVAVAEGALGFGLDLAEGIGEVVGVVDDADALAAAAVDGLDEDVDLVARRLAAWAVVTIPSLPGTVVTLRDLAVLMALDLLPIISML